MDQGRKQGLAQYHAQQFLTDPMEAGKDGHLMVAMHVCRGYYSDYHHYSHACIAAGVSFVSKDTWDYHCSNLTSTR